MDQKLKRLGEIISQRHDRALADLLAARRLIGHPGEKGSVTEQVWLDLFKKYLPERYNARQAFVVDHTGQLSDQIDIVIHDSLYTPFILEFGGHEIVPIESVYAVFEVKQSVGQNNLNYALKKIQSVLELKRAVRPTEKVSDCLETKILSGLLATDVSWSKKSETKIADYRVRHDQGGILDFIVSGGHFVNYRTEDGIVLHDAGRSPISRFLLRFVSELQLIGTVKPINMEFYLKSLA